MNNYQELLEMKVLRYLMIKLKKLMIYFLLLPILK